MVQIPPVKSPLYPTETFQVVNRILYFGAGMSAFCLKHKKIKKKNHNPPPFPKKKKKTPHIKSPIFEWYVIRCPSKNEYQKDMCLKEIGIHAKKMKIFLDIIVNIIGGGGRDL